MENKYKPVIGLEIHVELKTKSKMFCQCSADYFGKEPNSNTCPVCLGMPGALPVPNKKAIEWTVLIGKALNCEINKISKFDRKHYFYPDLPKGYQISQYDEPFCVKGHLSIKTKEGNKTFRIHRIHLEEDTGKLMHEGDDTLIDFNRSSVPLVEIVTEPDFDNADDVKQFLEELHTLITYLDVSDADMEKGSMRLEPNISVKLVTAEGLPNYKVEVKNINSFNFVKRAIEYEVKRHIEILEKGETPPQETRGFSDVKMNTYSQRSKENAQDYRYFPEPDIPPIELPDKALETIAKMKPELPAERIERYEKEYGLKYQDAFIITREKKQAQYFEDVINKLDEQKLSFKVEDAGQKIANFIINKKVDSNLSVDEFVKEAVQLLTPKQTDTKLLDEMVSKVIAGNEKSVADYKSGKQNAIMFLVGQVMREMKGHADAQTVKSELEKKLK
jgi:aspartyl-tRNA(Asn)/glutamyl-tRNA(Gln) amidotransferase subunit B